MIPHSLLASAAINIGLGLVILFLFSILKKQPSNSPIYYPRPLSKRHPIIFPPPSSLCRFFPSFSWIPRAFCVTEDEILETGGLDALVVIRLFKFGNVDITGDFLHHLSLQEYSEILVKRIQQVRNLRHRPDQFTTLVQQIPFCAEHKVRGCCVDHFFSKHHPYSYHSYQMLYDGKDIEELSELPVAFVTFNSRWGAALAAQTQQHTNPLIWITEMAPEPSDVSWKNLAIQYKFLPLYQIGVILAASLLTVFFAVPVTAVQGIAKYEKLKKWFPPAMAIELIPGLSSVVTGYLPSAILKGFLYIVPFIMLAMAKASGSISKSKEEIKACNMIFYFLVGNVFFLSFISGSLLDEIGESFSHPKNLPSHLASLISSQADFFMTYILTEGLSGFSLEILQPGLLLWDFLKSHTYGRGKEKDLYLIVIPPLMLPFLIVYFFLGYAVYINQIQDVYDTVYDTCGRFWPFIHHYIIVAIILTQITMIGLFGLKSKPAASIFTIPLVLLTIMFNEYCKIRFLPTFGGYSIQNAVENDKLDEKSDNPTDLYLACQSSVEELSVPSVCNDGNV
ncbi:hypothetical protein CRYUN_Cryun41cG0070500 [Craigia yunnanensis]